MRRIRDEGIPNVKRLWIGPSCQTVSMALATSSDRNPTYIGQLSFLAEKSVTFNTVCVVEWRGLKPNWWEGMRLSSSM